jgi:hypothetical protein
MPTFRSIVEALDDDERYVCCLQAATMLEAYHNAVDDYTTDFLSFVTSQKGFQERSKRDENIWNGLKARSATRTLEYSKSRWEKVGKVWGSEVQSRLQGIALGLPATWQDVLPTGRTQSKYSIMGVAGSRFRPRNGRMYWPRVFLPDAVYSTTP